MKKKWFWVILILAIVAVVLTIVFINLFREKDTRELSDKINSVVTNGYLSDKGEDESDEYVVINAYFDEVYSNLSTVEEKAEVKNYQDTYKAYVVAGKFFNKQFVFSKFTDVYKNNRKAVASKFDKAQEAADNLKKYIVDNKEVVGGSDYWQANTWVNCKGYANEMFVQTIGAFDLLQAVYQDCVPSKIMKNDLTGLVFETMSEFSKQTKEKLNSDENCAFKLYNFVNVYLTESGEKLILNFIYNQTAQDKIADIKEKGTQSAGYPAFLVGNIER